MAGLHSGFSVARATYRIAEDFFIGETKQLTQSLASEHLDPNSSFYVTPFSQRSAYEKSALIGFAALEISQVGKAFKLGRWGCKGIKYGLNGIRSISKLTQANKTAYKASNTFRYSMSELKAAQYGLHLNDFNKYAMGLSDVGKNNIRALRKWAKSKGYTKLPNPLGKPETWRSQNIAGEKVSNLVIKPSGSFRSNIQTGSGVPRFDAKLDNGIFINPFTGQTGGRSVGTHIPLEHKYW